MGKRDKLFQKMETLEVELLEHLLPALERAAGGQDDLVFLSSRVRPKTYTGNLRSAEADELTSLAEDLVNLYEQLDVGSSDKPAARYLKASSDCYDVSNHHRGAPQGIAAQLLAELHAGGPDAVV